MTKFKLTLIGLLAYVFSSCLSMAAGWEISLPPASFNTDKAVRLIADRGQLLTLQLYADDSIRSRGNRQDVTIELNLPESVTLLGNNGSHRLLNERRQTVDGRSIYSYDASLESGLIGFKGEWNNQNLFIRTPDSIPAKDAFIEVTLKEKGEPVTSTRLAIQLEPLAQIGSKPKKTKIGVWSYGVHRANVNEESSEQMAEFLADAGVNLVTMASGSFADALRKHGVMNGGVVHHALFQHPAYQDINAQGRPSDTAYAFSCPQQMIELPEGTPLPGVSHLIKAARDGDGIASIDYEPTGGSGGFSDLSVTRFKEQYGVSDEDFAEFRAYVVKHRYAAFKTDDKKIADIWKKWTLFRTEQTAKYMERLQREMKASEPSALLAITPMSPYGDDTLITQALGINNASLAAGSDIIMPQIYAGYSGRQVKLTMDFVKGWKDDIQRFNPETELWPILLVRFANAGVYNNPERLRQQTVGALAHGAESVIYYYPENMEAPHWNMLTGLVGEIAAFEDYYHDGKVVTADFKLSGMPTSTVKVEQWPNLQLDVENPDWEFTAHELNGEYLLTLFNLKEQGELAFAIDLKGFNVIESRDVVERNGKWFVPAQGIGFLRVRR